MTGRRAVGLVAEREIRERLRTKAFRISTAIMCVLVVGAAVAGGVIGNGSTKTIKVGTVGADAGRVGDGMRAAGPALDRKVRSVRQPDAAAARRAVDDGDVDLAIVPGSGSRPRLLTGTDTDSLTQSLAQQAFRADAQRQALARAGVPSAERRAIIAPRALQVTEVGDSDRDTRRGIAFVGALLLYLAILTYGLTVASGVVEEKSSRVVEVLQAAVAPRHLLLGKVVGLGLVGLAQLALFVALGVGAGIASGAFDAPGVAVGAAAITALWFLLGYLLYSCAYATAGAISARQEDLQSTTAPLTILLVVAYLVSTGTASSPDSTLSVVASFLPPFAPIIMPARAILGAAAWWEVVVSAVLTLLTAALLLRVADLAYRGASLKVRGRTGLRAALGRS